MVAIGSSWVWPHLSVAQVEEKLHWDLHLVLGERAERSSMRVDSSGKLAQMPLARSVGARPNVVALIVVVVEGWKRVHRED